MVLIENTVDNFQDLVRVATIPRHLFHKQTAVAFPGGVDSLCNLVFGLYPDGFAHDELVSLPWPPTEHVPILPPELCRWRTLVIFHPPNLASISLVIMTYLSVTTKCPSEQVCRVQCFMRKERASIPIIIPPGFTSDKNGVCAFGAPS
jgi:hypothetical protein